MEFLLRRVTLRMPQHTFLINRQQQRAESSLEHWFYGLKPNVHSPAQVTKGTATQPT
jgi:hypothetical protein